MLGTFGFSYVGLLYLAMLFTPNLLWTKRRPKGDVPVRENPVLVWLERIGQVWVTAVVLVFSDFNPAPVGWWNLWLALSFALMLLYEACWVRYFWNPTAENFYRNLWGIPIPLATLPVAAFFLLGVYGKVGLLMIGAALLGVGHIGIHVQHCRKLQGK